MAKVVQKFSKELIKETFGLPHDPNPEFVEVIEDKISGHGRWCVYHDLIFKYQDKYYFLVYTRGATEQQDLMPFDDEYGDIEATLVRPVTITTTTYTPIIEEEINEKGLE